jgi:hypothetical protein
MSRAAVPLLRHLRTMLDDRLWPRVRTENCSMRSPAAAMKRRLRPWCGGTGRWS